MSSTVIRQYEPEEPKKKHHWDYPEAGFVVQHHVLCGKCPSDMSMAEAENLLSGALVFKRHPDGSPKRLYAVKDGVVYRAMPTLRGVSYHGFPERPSELRRLPQAFRDQLLTRATELGCEDETREWMARRVDPETGEWMDA